MRVTLPHHPRCNFQTLQAPLSQLCGEHRGVEYGVVVSQQHGGVLEDRDPGSPKVPAVVPELLGYILVIWRCLMVDNAGGKSVQNRG